MMVRPQTASTLAQRERIARGLLRLRLQRERFIVTAVLLLDFCGALAISHFILLRQSIRLDESQSIWQAAHTLPGMLYTVAHDVHVPLYHTLLHYWMIFFGTDISTVRLLSLIFFLLSIPVAYLVARAVLPVHWALLVSALYSFSPFMNWYANEARMYTLLCLMSLLSMYFFLKIIRTNSGWWGYALAAVIGAYSHYFFVFVLATEGAFFLVMHRQFAKRSFVKLVAIGASVILALSPWLYYFHKLGSGGGERPHLAKPTTIDFSNIYSQFMFGFTSNHVNTIILSCWPILFVLLMLGIRRGVKANLPLSFFLTMAFGPVVFAFVLSFVVSPFFLSRYLIACALPLMIAMIWLISKYPKVLALVVASFIVALSGFGLWEQSASAQTPVKENYRQIVEYLNTHVSAQDAVAISTPYTLYPIEYYYHGAARIYTLPNWDGRTVIPTFSESTMPAQITALNASHRYVYLVLSQDQGYERTIAQYYLGHFKQVAHTTYSQYLLLYVYQVGDYTPVAPLADETYTVAL